MTMYDDQQPPVDRTSSVFQDALRDELEQRGIDPRSAAERHAAFRAELAETKNADEIRALIAKYNGEDD